jgi:orotidine-5'-phosphate decarboxylase
VLSDRPFAQRALESMSKYGQLVIGLDPSGDLLEQWGLGDTPDGLERFVDVALEAAVGTVGVVKPQSAFYERHGWEGMRSLSRLVAAFRQAGVLVLLDAKRGDVGSTNQAYAESYLGDDAGLAVDAMTVTPYLGVEAMAAFFERATLSNSGVFVVTRSSNAEGRAVQTAHRADGKTVEQSIISAVADLNRQLSTDDVGPIGCVFGPNHGYSPELRIEHLGGLFLAPGLGAQGATPDDVAECFRDCPDRVLASASRSVLASGPDPAAIRRSAQRLNDELAQALTV